MAVFQKLVLTGALISTVALAGCGGGGGGGTTGVAPGTSANFSSGFPTDPTAFAAVLQSNLSTNNPVLTGTPAKQSSSLFFIQPLKDTAFTTSYTFNLTGPNFGDGLTFCLQGLSPTALGGTGSRLGFGFINHSVAVKYDVFQNTGDPSGNCTGLFTNGNNPVGGVDLTPSSINLESGDTFQATLNYDGTHLTSTLLDLTTNATNTQVYTVDIPTIIGSQGAYVGFTSASDIGTNPVHILTWSYTSGNPA